MGGFCGLGDGDLAIVWVDIGVCLSFGLSTGWRGGVCCRTGAVCSGTGREALDG